MQKEDRKGRRILSDYDVSNCGSGVKPQRFSGTFKNRKMVLEGGLEPPRLCSRQIFSNTLVFTKRSALLDGLSHHPQLNGRVSGAYGVLHDKFVSNRLVSEPS
ncbi:MAG TPA: hypothetical protein DCF95_02085 [Gammaproteobacteria bacterium]|nr:hypothetical protein [Gammaproteobacteria bacterium]|tara:strand:- start:422 stop:730 length:309 start_codon:yes stop_codon:yes gene_type:complete